jgi:uncharacterized protein
MRAERKPGRPIGHFMIDVERLKQGPVAFDCDIPLDWLSAELSACEYPAVPCSGRLVAEATQADSGVLVDGRAIARVKTECCTCLAEVELDLTAPLSAFLMERKEAAGEIEDEGELTPEDLEREWFEGPVIVLDDIVRDSIVLELPMTPRCEGECRGEAIAHIGRKQDRVDPRLAQLAGIRLQKEK